MTWVGGFYIKKHHYDEETRKKKLSDWHERYRATFPYEGNFCNWLKLPWNDKPVTPKYLKEYEYQKALVEEFYEYQGVYDGLPSCHKYNGNDGKYHEIFYQEQRKIIAQQRKETDEFLKKIRGSNVTTGHKDKPINKPKRNSNPNPIKRIEYRD